MQRDLSLDSLKAFLIYLVILGHLIKPSCGNTGAIIHTFIYLFHIPLFSLISGYLTNRENSLKGISLLSETFLVWHTIGLLVIGVCVWHIKISLYSIISPFWHYWYLFSLILWRSLIVIINKYTRVRVSMITMIILLSILLALAAGYIDIIEYPFSLSRTIVYLPFFMTGWWLRETKKLYILRKSNYRWISLIILCLFVIIVAVYPDWGRVIYGSQPYCDIYASNSEGLFMRMFYLLCAFLISFAFLSLWNGITVFSRIGCNTLKILVFHSWFILLFGYYFDNSTFLVFLISIIIFALCAKLSETYFATVILNPISYLREKIYDSVWGGQN